MGKREPLELFQTRLAEALAECKKRGISEREVERRAHLSTSQISRWKTGARGKNIGHQTAKDLARALGVHLEWLQGESDGPRDLDAQALEFQALEGLPAVDDTLRAIVKEIYRKQPHADPVFVRNLVLGEEQRMIREDNELHQRRTARVLKRLEQKLDEEKSPPPKSKRRTGTT